MVSSTTPSARRTSNTSSLRRLSSSGVKAESSNLTYQTIVHASIAGRTMGCQVATTVSFNNTTASQKTVGPAVVRVPCIDDTSSDGGSSGCSSCSCDDCQDASTGTMTPSTVTKSPPRQTRGTSSTRATRSAASALPPTSKLLSPSPRRIPTGRPSSVPPAVVRPTSTPVQTRRSSISPPLERYMSDVSSPSDTNSLRSQQGSVATQLVSARRPTSAPQASVKAGARRPSSSSDVSPSTLLRYGEFHPVRDSSMWKGKKTSQQPTTPKKTYSSPRHNVIKSKNTLASPNLCFESCQGSTAVGLSATSASTAMMAKFPAWQHEQLRQHQGPTSIMTEGLHASEWGHVRVKSPEKPNVRGGSSKGRRAPPPPLQSESSVVDLECGETPCSVVKESKSDDALGETSNSMKILRLSSCATKLRFVLITAVTLLLLVASLALYYDLNVANKQTV